MSFVDEETGTHWRDGAGLQYSLPADALRHLPLLIEAAKGIVNAYSWRGKKGYQSAMAQGVMELRSALEPFALVDEPRNQQL